MYVQGHRLHKQINTRTKKKHEIQTKREPLTCSLQTEHNPSKPT